jgi:hypothetical protein
MNFLKQKSKQHLKIFGLIFVFCYLNILNSDLLPFNIRNNSFKQHQKIQENSLLSSNFSTKAPQQNNSPYHFYPIFPKNNMLFKSQNNPLKQRRYNIFHNPIRLISKGGKEPKPRPKTHIV